MRSSGVIRILKILMFLWIGVLSSCVLYSTVTALLRWGAGEEPLGPYLLGLSLTSMAIGTYLYWLYGLIWFALMLFVLQIRSSLLNYMNFPVDIVAGMVWVIAFIGINVLLESHWDVLGSTVFGGLAAAVISVYVLMVMCARKRSQALE